nr:hypothetical protein [Candidatus Woesearchaeota archaeon]
MKIKKLYSILAFILLLSGIVSAFGVSSPYWEDSPLTMSAGEKQIINLNLQNMVGEDNMDVQLKVITGEDIVKLDQEIYNIDAGYSLDAPIKIFIPRSAVDGDIYEVKIETKTISPSDSGQMIDMGVGSITSFNVLVSGKVPNYLLYLIVGISVILIIALIIYLLHKRKLKNKNK